VNRVHRHGGKIKQVYVPVKASIEAKVAEIGGNPVTVGGVIAANRYRNFLV
jgi:hypothetical protein